MCAQRTTFGWVNIPAVNPFVAIAAARAAGLVIGEIQQTRDAVERLGAGRMQASEFDALVDHFNDFVNRYNEMESAVVELAEQHQRALEMVDTLVSTVGELAGEVSSLADRHNKLTDHAVDEIGSLWTGFDAATAALGSVVDYTSESDDPYIDHAHRLLGGHDAAVRDTAPPGERIQQ